MRIRRIALVLVLAGLLSVAAVQPAAAEPDFSCFPTTADCTGGWNRANVLLTWSWPQNQYHGTCPPTWLRTDTRGRELSCVIHSIVGTVTRETSTIIRLDKTPPRLHGIAPNRPPDYGGWFNHPVTLGFRGSDATSGIASCTTVPYAGPGGGPAWVAGRCNDVAGNTASGAFPLYYDSTPPRAPRVAGMPGNRTATISWSTAADVGLVHVVRSHRGGAAKLAFSGRGRSFRDRGLRNGVAYRYDVIAVDQAGNRSTTAAVVFPTSSHLLLPRRGARLRQPPLLVWKRARRARYYNVQLYRGGVKVLTAWPRRAQFKLHRRWTYRGRRRTLRPGRYTWYIWPGLGRRSDARYGRRLGKSSFVVVR